MLTPHAQPPSCSRIKGQVFVILLPPAHPFPLVTSQHILSIFQTRQSLLCMAPSPRFPCRPPSIVCSIHSYEKHPDLICHSHTATLSYRALHGGDDQMMFLSCAEVINCRVYFRENQFKKLQIIQIRAEKGVTCALTCVPSLPLTAHVPQLPQPLVPGPSKRDEP